MNNGNFLEHSAIFHDRSILKLMLTLPATIDQFRSIMVECVKLNKFITFTETIESLCKGKLDDLFKSKYLISENKRKS